MKNKEGTIIITQSFKATPIIKNLCSNCSKEIDRDDNFCRYCGMKIIGIEMKPLEYLDPL